MCQEEISSKIGKFFCWWDTNLNSENLSFHVPITCTENIGTVTCSRVPANLTGSSLPPPPVRLCWYWVLSVPMMDQKTAVSLLPPSPTSPPALNDDVGPKWDWTTLMMKLFLTEHFSTSSSSWCYPCFDVCCVMLHLLIVFYVDVTNRDLLSDLSTACLTVIQDVDEWWKGVYVPWWSRLWWNRKYMQLNLKIFLVSSFLHVNQMSLKNNDRIKSLRIWAFRMFTLIWPYQVSLKWDVCVLKSLNCDVVVRLWTRVPQERVSAAVTHPSPNERSFMGKLADLDLTKQTDAQMSIQPAANRPHSIHMWAETFPLFSNDVCVGWIHDQLET